MRRFADKTTLFILGIFIFTAMTSFSSLATAGYQQPVFNLKFSIYGTGAEIRLNDIPVYFSDSVGQTNSQKAIPESIIDGENTLSIRSFPLEEDGGQYRDGAYIEASITIREKTASQSENKPVLHLKLNPTQEKAELVRGSLPNLGDKPLLHVQTDQQTVISRRAQIQSPFPRWAWQDGQTIEDTPDNFNSLLEKYKEIWTALNTGDKAKVFSLYDVAAQEFAQAYYYSDKKEGHRLMETGGLIGDDSWGLGGIDVRIKKKKYTMQIYGNKKLARIIDEKGNESLVTYLNKNVRMVNFQKFGFYKNKNGEWIMIR